MNRMSSAPSGVYPDGTVTSFGTGRVSELTKAPLNTSAHGSPASGPSTQTVPSTRLTPADPFPGSLAELELTELQVLHSRIALQLDREYCTDPAGPHPVSVDRAQELVAELATRQDFLTPAHPSSPADLRAGTASTSRGPDTPGRPAAAVPPMPAPEGRAPTRAEQSPPSTPSHDEAGTSIHDLDRLRAGHPIEVWHRGQMQCVGTVDETAPSLGVVWIREALDGYRRMVHTQDTELRHHRPGSPR